MGDALQDSLSGVAQHYLLDAQETAMTNHTDGDESATPANAEAAEAAALEVETRAAAARARAVELRRLAESGTASATTSASEIPAVTADPVPTPLHRGVRWGALGLAATALAVCALSGLSATMFWQQHQREKQQQRIAEYAAVARQSAINLMSLDYNDAKGSVQRVLDGATGEFKENFESQSAALIKGLADAKVVTTVTVQSVAVQQHSDDSAVVLVAAQSQATNVQDARKAPQKFRVVVTLATDDGQLKTSQVDFV